jgi:ankyrin repeat protein
MRELVVPCISDNNGDDTFLVVRDQSIELRKGLEELMEHIQSHRLEESSESVEERYLLLVSSYPSNCLSMAVTLTDADVMEHSSAVISSGSPTTTSEATLRLPIHLACDKAAPLSIVKSLLDADANNGDHPSILKADKWGDLPIHIACSRASAALSASDRELYDRGWQALAAEQAHISHPNDAVESIRLLLEADKDKKTLSIFDVYESLPLHTAARYNAPPEVICMLLEGGGGQQHGAKSGLYTEGFHGQFPLMVACRSGSPRPEVLRILLAHDDASASNIYRKQDEQPSTILHKDATGRLPIHVFLLRNTCEICLRILLEGMLGRSRSNNTTNNIRANNNNRALPNRNSILAIGLDAWKRQWLREMIPAMDGTNLYERDFTTRDKLDVICTEARAFWEACVSLELVVWKMSCLSGIREAQETNDQQQEEYCNTKLMEDGGFKRNRRIVSGVESIVPNVLSFLEDEPVERILEQFHSYGYLGKNN